MDEEQLKLLTEMVMQMKRVADQLEYMNLNGVTVFGGSTMEEN